MRWVQMFKNEIKHYTTKITIEKCIEHIISTHIPIPTLLHTTQ